MTVQWVDDQKTIISTISQGAWTWEEYHESLDQVLKMARSVDYRIDLVNIAGTDSITPKGSGMPHYQRALNLLPSNVSLIVLTNRSLIVKAIFSVFSRLRNQNKLAGPRLIAAQTFEEAYKLIQEDRRLETR